MRSRGRKGRGHPKRKPIGIIAEDLSDIEVIDLLIGKIAKSAYSIRSFKGDGCGKIIGKCLAWSQTLYAQGCRYLIVVHDLDQSNRVDLNAKLVAALRQSPMASRVIVIPVREIEAWLLADHQAINRAMKLKTKLNKIPAPEAISSPKERLGREVYVRSGHARRYVNSLDNKKIAAECTVACLARCQSFEPFRSFVASHI